MSGSCFDVLIRSARILFAFGCLLTALHCMAQVVGGTSVILPAPSGPFSVGRVTYALVDLSRPEPLAHQDQAHRELMVDVWYPAQGNSTA